MRDGWKAAKVEDIAQVINGGTPKTKVPEYWGGDHLWITPADMGRLASPYIESSRRKLTDAGLKNSSASLLPKNSVILSTRAPIGHLVINAEPMAFNQGCRGLIPRADVDSKYLYYFLYSSVELLNELGSGTTFKELSAGKLKKVEIPLPPLPEQNRIVAILDEAFAGIATAVANTEKNLANARELFRTSLAICFSQYRELPDRLTSGLLTDGPTDASSGPLNDGGFLAAKSSTRGRAETDRIIEGKLSLSVGMPSIQPRRGWRWTKLTNLARLESGHTPSRKRPEYWGGDIPWLGITDARAYHGRVIEDTEQHTNQLGIDNSAARILPAGTVCLSRTASVGYVVLTGAEMATSQDFVNWVCSSELNPHFLKYLLQSEWRDFSRFSSGSVHQTIYFPEVKAFHICHPGLREQKRIVEFLDEMRANAASFESICHQKLIALAELKQSLLQKAFSGELTAGKEASDAIRKVEEVA